uniref:Uncharacterized protein n=1 Tax=Panagrolaimus sp. JU765 TaxID=591449 RepID=A0AC34R9D1_9BILA
MASPENPSYIFAVVDSTGVQLGIPLIDDCITLSTIHVNFGNQYRLVYELEDGVFKGKRCKVNLDPTGKYLIRPPLGWAGKTYHIVRKLVRLPSSTDAKKPNPPPCLTFDPRSGFLIKNQKILTATHLGFEQGKTYTIYDFRGQQFNADCLHINIKHDFAVLYCPELPNLTLHFEALTEYRDYYFMGFPTDADPSVPSVSKGHINKIENYSSIEIPEAKRGYFGGPVFNWAMGFSGILISPASEVSSNSAVDECNKSSMEQPCAKFLDVCFILGCLSKVKL